jgi:hypothetical protein
MYRILPRVAVAWRDVWVGSAATALLFTLGKYGVGIYIGHAAVSSGFGAAGSVVVLLVWVYYSSQLFLLGAEFTWVYAHSHGSRVTAGSEAKTVQPPPYVEEVEVEVPGRPGGSEVGTPNIPHPQPTLSSRTSPTGLDFLSAAMVSFAFGFVHWYLRTHSAAAASVDASFAAHRLRTSGDRERTDGT